MDRSKKNIHSGKENQLKAWETNTVEREVWETYKNTFKDSSNHASKSSENNINKTKNVIL